MSDLDRDRDRAAAEARVRPSAPLENLRRRAELLARTRRFFAERGVLEVETPLLAEGVIVETHIDPVRCVYRPEGPRTRDEDRVELFLLPSPEAAMKRLLVEGSGPIYQISKAFREGEVGRKHSPEFTMLEWYRPGFDLDDLIAEVGDLTRSLLGVERWEVTTYRDLFEETVGVDPFEATTPDLRAAAQRLGIPIPFGLDDGHRNGWLELLLVTTIEPEIGREVPLFVRDFPPTQAALAQIGGASHPVAERFELFYRGYELANGYHELLDPREHRLRFQEANVRRTGDKREALPVDARFLAALERGLPPCAGVAVGFDRLVMLACGAESIAEVISFAHEYRR